MVLDRVSLTIDQGDRLGLLGRNGAGKTTLIRCLNDAEPPDGGTIQRKRDLLMRTVEQMPALNFGTVDQAIRSGLVRQQSLLDRLEAIENRLESEDGGELQALVEEQSELSDALELAGGRSFAHRADAMLEALQAPKRDRNIEELSLGERRRVALAIGLIEQPDLLILDEPTNHLDVETIEWLERHLREYPGAVLLVTHDRHFLETVCNRIAEIDRGDLYLYAGNYRRYLEQKAMREDAEAKAEANRQQTLRSELEWVRRGPPARTTKSKARLERYENLAAANPKQQLGEASLQLPHPERLGKTILELDKVSKAYGAKILLRELSLLMTPGARIGVVGPNGAGKTTLLKMILGEIEPDSGRILRGQNTKMVYVDQARSNLDSEKTVLEEVGDGNDTVFVGTRPVSIYSFLDGLLFDGAQQRAKIGTLSGGERTRVALAKQLRQSGNLLILDEPTNDLDLATLRVLEDALCAYPGCVVVVSHDRWFLDRVTTATLVFEGEGQVVFYEGGHADWRKSQKLPAPSTSTPQAVTKPKRPPSPAKPKRRSFKQQQEFEGIEDAIAEAEETVSTLQTNLADPETHRRLGAAVAEEVERLQTQEAEVERLYARWGELSELEPYGG